MLFFFSLLFFACGSVEPIVVGDLPIETVDRSATYAEEYFTGHGDWAHHVKVVVGTQEKTTEWCKRDVPACTLSRYQMVVSEDANPCEAILHEFGHIAGMRFFGDSDPDHKRFSDFFNRYVFESCQNS